MEEEEDIIEEEIPEKQSKNSRIAPLLPYQWKKGQSGNPAGRPKGKTMKEYARDLLSCQTEEERQEFLHGLPKEVIWKMAEGAPKQDNDLKVTGLTLQFVEDFKNANTTLGTEKDNPLDSQI